MIRTSQQNRALHLWCDRLAESLNDAGYSFNDGKIIEVDVDFTKENIKEYMVHAVMTALYPDMKSTSELSTTQMQSVYEHIVRLLADKKGFTAPDWPHHE